MSRPGFSFLLCPDPELTRQRLEALTAEFGEGGAWERRVHWGDEELPGAFWSDLSIPDLMGTRRLVVVRRAHKFLKDTWDKLTPLLGSKSDTIWPVFCLESEPDKKGAMKPPAVLTKTKFWPVAEKRGWVWSSPGLTARGMPDYVRAYAAAHGLTLSRDVERALCEALPQDALGAKNELDKIALAAGDSGQVQREHLRAIAYQADMDLFSFLSAAIDGSRPEQVWQKVMDNRQLSATDSIFFAFLSLLQRDARQLWELAAGEQPSSWMPAAARAPKAALAKRIGVAGVAHIWNLALEAEFGVKSGQRSPEQAFEALVGGLHAAFRPKRSH